MKTIYYPVIILASSPKPLRYGPACDTIPEADDYIRDKIAEDKATMGVVAKFAGGDKTLLESHVFPQSARKIVRHWLDMWDSLETQHEAD